MATIVSSIGDLLVTVSTTTDDLVSPIVVTTVEEHGLSNDQRVLITGVVGNTNANGTHEVKNVTATTFELDGTTGNGDYDSGGDVKREYGTIEAWEAATDVALSGDIYEGHVYADYNRTTEHPDSPMRVASSTFIEIAGATGQSGGTNYRHLRAGVDHEYDPVTGTGARILKQTSNTDDDGSGLIINEDYARVSNIGVIMVNDTDAALPTSGTHYGIEVKGTDGNLVEGCTVDWSACGTVSTALMTCFVNSVTGSSGGLIFRNCLAIGSDNDTIGARVGFEANSITAGSYEIYNCAAWGMQFYGFNLAWNNASLIVSNCIAAGSAQGDFEFPGSPVIDFDYCISTDATATGTNSLTDIPVETLFNASQYKDFRPLQTSPSLNIGEDLSGVWTSADDLTNTLRSTASEWDIGPYDDQQAVAGAPPAPTTTISSIGAGKDYTTTQAWVTATATNLVGQNKIHIGELYDQEDLGTAELIIRDAVASPSRYRELRAANGERYNAQFDSGPKLHGDDTAVVRIQEPHFRLTGIGVIQDDATAATDRETLVVDAIKGVTLDSVLAGHEEGDSSTAGGRKCIYLRFGTDHIVQNCIGRGGTNTAGADRGIVNDTDGVIIQHCSVNRIREGATATGIVNTGARVQITNCIVSRTDICFSPGTARMSHCISSDATAVGLGALTNVANPDIYFADSAGDYRLISSSPAVDSAKSIGLAHDYTGAPRVSPHERGAYTSFVFAEVWQTPPGQVMHHCRCWSIVRDVDSVGLFFTDHNTPVTFRGDVYTPIGGFNRSASSIMTGLRVGDTEFTGPITDAAISVDDLLAGMWDGAKVDEYVVNWYAPFTQPYDHLAWIIDSFTFDGEEWQAKLVNVADRLTDTITDTHTRNCPYPLYSYDPPRGWFCKVDRASYETEDVHVKAVNDDRLEFTVDNGATANKLPTETDGFYNRGEVVWTVGDNVGTVSEIASYTTAASVGTIKLRLETPFPIDDADEANITPGCDGRFVTCRDDYANEINFGGDPHVPGLDETINAEK